MSLFHFHPVGNSRWDNLFVDWGNIKYTILKNMTEAGERYRQPTLYIPARQGMIKAEAQSMPNYRVISAPCSAPLGSRQGYIVFGEHTWVQ